MESLPNAYFGRALECEGVDDEAIQLGIVLSYWIGEPPHDYPENLSDLDSVKQLEARYECQESRKDAEALAKESISFTTKVILNCIPTAKSTRNPERLVKAVKYFIGKGWVPGTIIEKPVREFWDREDLSTLVPLADNSDDDDDDDDEDGIDVNNFNDKTKWKDLKTYVRMHDCIAQLIGHGLVKKPRYAAAVFREASDSRRPKGDPFRKAASAAASAYRRHAGEQLKELGCDPEQWLEPSGSFSHHIPGRHPLWRSASHIFIFVYLLLFIALLLLDILLARWTNRGLR